MRGYKDLVVWQKSVWVAKQVYLDTEHFPKSQMFSLAQQMQRAAVSISSNIAEGHNRNSTKEFIYFLGVALGSLGELETQYTIAESLSFVEPARTTEMLNVLSEIGMMIRALTRKLKEVA